MVLVFHVAGLLLVLASACCLATATAASFCSPSMAAFATSKRTFSIPCFHTQRRNDCHNTALSSATTSFNFGPVSSRDTTVFTVERPGNSLVDESSTTQRLTLEDVKPWLDYMVAQGITQAIALLDDNELEVYQDPPGLLGMYQAVNIQGHVVSMNAPDAPTKILGILQQASETGDKVACHCTGGIGRSGRVAAAWLVQKYGLSPEDATAETLAKAKESGVIRKGAVDMLQKWMGNTE